MIMTLFLDVLICLIDHLILSLIKYLMCFDEYTLHLNKPILNLYPLSIRISGDM